MTPLTGTTTGTVAEAPTRAPTPEDAPAPTTAPGPRRDRRLAVATTVAALGIAAASSWWRLTVRPLWIDEAISLGATNQLRQTIRGTGGTMALYYVLLDGWTAVFGPSVRALRSLSLVLVLAALALLSILLRRLLPPSRAAVALLTTAALPALVRLAQDARAYALVLLLTIACWTCLTRAVEADAAGDRRAARRWCAALVPLMVAGVLSQALFLLQVPALVLSVAVHVRRWRLVAGLLPALVAAGATLAALLTMGLGDVGDWIPPIDGRQVHTVGIVLLAGRTPVMALLGGLILLGAVAVAARVRRQRADPVARWKAAVPLWWGLLPVVLLFALSTVRPSLLGRYVSASIPGLGLLVAAGAGALWTLVGPRPGSAGARPRRRSAAAGRWAAGSVVLLVVVATLVVGRLPQAGVTFEDWDAAATYLAEQARPGDGLIFTHAGPEQAHPDTVRPPFEAAWDRLPEPRVALVPLSPARPLGEVRRFDALTDPEVLSARMVRYERVWVVQFPHFGGSLLDLLAIEPARSGFVRRPAATFNGGMQVILLQRR